MSTVHTLPHLGQMESAVGGAGCEEEMVGEEEHLSHRLLLRLLEGGAEGTQAASTRLHLLMQHLYE